MPGYPILKLTLACTLLAVLASPLVAAATAPTLERGYELVTRTVKFADLDLRSKTGVATLYERIQSAAKQVCEPENSRTFEHINRIRRCEQRAVDQAVMDVNSPGLTEYHREQTGALTLLGLVQR
jgi:UrcA family protein